MHCPVTPKSQSILLKLGSNKVMQEKGFRKKKEIKNCRLKNTRFDLVNTETNDKFFIYFSGLILSIFTIVIVQMHTIFSLFFFSLYKSKESQSK